VIGKELAAHDGLAMNEVGGTFMGKQVEATHFRGLQSIDRVWAMSRLVVVGACVMPIGFGIGDHKMFIVDFSMSSMVGKDPPRIVRPMSRRLNTRIEGCA